MIGPLDRVQEEHLHRRWLRRDRRRGIRLHRRRQRCRCGPGEHLFAVLPGESGNQVGSAWKLVAENEREMQNLVRFRNNRRDPRDEIGMLPRGLQQNITAFGTASRQ